MGRLAASAAGVRASARAPARTATRAYMHRPFGKGQRTRDSLRTATDAALRRAGTVKVPQVTATTDFETHRLWVNQPCDHYFTATAEGAAYLRYWGVPAADVTVTGIPIHPVFSRPRDRKECLARHGLAGDRPIVLQLAGGFGVGPIEKLYQALLQIPTPIELVV